jgi:hypothetical protein
MPEAEVNATGMRYFESRNSAITSRVCWLGTTGTTSKVMPSSWQFGATVGVPGAATAPGRFLQAG